MKQQGHEKQRGWLTLITAAMYGGKTETLIHRALLYEQRVGLFAAFKPEVDTRDGAGIIKSKSKNGLEIEAYEIPTDNPHLIVEQIQKTPLVHCAVIDEIQFFDDKKIVATIEELLHKKFWIIAAGLDLDFRGVPFGGMPTLMELAKQNGIHIPLYAHCCQCGGLATRTQRLTKTGEPVSVNDPIVVIEKNRNYEPRCSDCYVEPR